MFKFYIKKCYIRRTCYSETKRNLKNSYFPIYKIARGSTYYDRFRTKDLTIHFCRRSRLGYNDTYHFRGKFGIYNPRNIFPETPKIRRNSGSPKKTEILVFRISRSNRKKIAKSIRSICWSTDQ